MLTPENVLTVSQVNSIGKRVLETQFPSVWISGEISNLVQHGSGHWYFTLKDARAQIRCAMFKGRNRSVKFKPSSGQAVLVRGSISLYEAQGSFQLIADAMQPEGIGELQLAYQQLKTTLEKEGLFDQDNKLALPVTPSNIGVITSPSGAAIADILSVLNRRYPLARVTVIASQVQGDEAPSQLCRALAQAIRYGGLDVIIIGRGGGSIEDLWAFNDEALARAIAACPIPIISAVGHETDFTIADFVADVRAPTPSASAELAVPDAKEWQQRFDDYQDRLIKAINLSIRQQRQQVSALQKQLKHPKEQLFNQKLQLKQMYKRLTNAGKAELLKNKNQLAHWRALLVNQHPQHRIDKQITAVNYLQERLTSRIHTYLSQAKQRLAADSQLLHAVSPLNILSRGFGIIEQDGRVINSVKSITPEKTLTITLHDGLVTSDVKKIKPNDQ